MPGLQQGSDRHGGRRRAGTVLCTVPRRQRRSSGQRPRRGSRRLRIGYQHGRHRGRGNPRQRWTGGHELLSVATREGAEAIVATAIEHFEGPCTVDDAGILRDGAFHKMTDENWDAVIKVHFYGGYHVTRAAWPHLREQKFGRVVMAASTSGVYGNFGQANYGAAKLGLVGLINTLAIEAHSTGIPRMRSLRWRPPG